MENPTLFKNKVVLVIGAANQLCRYIVNAFLQEAAYVIVPADSLHDIEAIKAYKGNKEYKTFITQITDVADYDKVLDLCDTIVQKFGKIDIVVILCCAGTAAKRLSGISFDNWCALFESDLNPFFINADIALQVMKPNKTGMVAYVTDSDRFEDSGLARIALAAKMELSKVFAKEAMAHGLKYYHLWVQQMGDENSSPVNNDANDNPEMVSEHIMKLYTGKAYHKDHVFQLFPEKTLSL